MVENCCEQCGEAPWIGVTNDSRIAFNVYDEWNPAHGGARPGSGRPQQSSGNQDARLDYEHGIQDGRTGNQAAPKACASLSEAETDTPGEEDPSETETESAREAADPAASDSEGFSQGVLSASASRRRGQIKWSVAVSPLIGRLGAGRHPPDSPQGKADVTSAQQMFDIRVWPEDLPAGEGEVRLATALSFVKKAAQNSERPMAYLTTLLKNLDQPERVLA